MLQFFLLFSSLLKLYLFICFFIYFLKDLLRIYATMRDKKILHCNVQDIIPHRNVRNNMHFLINTQRRYDLKSNMRNEITT